LPHPVSDLSPAPSRSSLLPADITPVGRSLLKRIMKHGLSIQSYSVPSLRRSSCRNRGGDRGAGIRHGQESVHSCRKRRFNNVTVGSIMNHLNRLPSRDIRTERLERNLFLSLGLATLTLIAITVYDSARFSVGEYNAKPELPNISSVQSVIQTNSAPTNLPVLRSGIAEERTRMSASSKPKS
jgi:hypothetical protein